MEKIITKNGKNDKDFDGIKWAIAARSKDATRYSITCINIDGGLIVATDGHRLHIYTPERDIDAGMYEVLKETKDIIVLRSGDTDGFKYPDYERVFPQHTHNGINDITSPTDKNQLLNLVANHVIKHAENDYDVTYLADAIPMGEDIHFEQSGENRPLIIRNQIFTKAAVVMPLRTN
jgi:hypothetical protein